MKSILQPNSRHCFACGMENPLGLKLRFYETSPGEISAEYTPPEHFEGYPGVLHGGIVATMLDEASARSHMGEVPPRFLYTAKLEIKYRKVVPMGEHLKLVGRAIRSRGRTAHAWAGIYDDAGVLLAEADSFLIDVPGDSIPTGDWDALGWKVYPETAADR